MISTSIFSYYRVPGIILYTHTIFPNQGNRAETASGFGWSQENTLGTGSAMGRRVDGLFFVYHIIFIWYYIRTYVHMCIHITITALINNVDHTWKLVILTVIIFIIYIVYSRTIGINRHYYLDLVGLLRSLQLGVLVLQPHGSSWPIPIWYSNGRIHWFILLLWWDI